MDTASSAMVSTESSSFMPVGMNAVCASVIMPVAMWAKMSMNTTIAIARSDTSMRVAPMMPPTQPSRTVT